MFGLRNILHGLQGNNLRLESVDQVLQLSDLLIFPVLVILVEQGGGGRGGLDLERREGSGA